MVHLIRETDDGFELRSRYWIGHRPTLELAGRELELTRPGRRLGITRRLTGLRLAYEQLLHHQIDFTHLAGFRAGIHAEFG